MFNYSNKLTGKELEQYSRHIILEQFNGQDGQLKLKLQKIVVIGAGGLGNICACYLASLGFGSITIIDDDNIELNNLNRQIAYSINDIGLPKAAQLVSNYDIVIDCTDNPHSRYCINDACAKLKIPLVFGSALRWEGQEVVEMMELLVQVIFKYLIIVVGIIGSMQALEALKISLQLDGVMSKRMLLFDGLTFRTRTIALRSKQTDCYSCSRHFNISELSFQPTACERQYRFYAIFNTIKYLKFLTEKTPHVLIDVRVHPQYNTAQFEHSINIPLENLINMTITDIFDSLLQKYSKEQIQTICFICRRGRKSRDAVNYFLKIMETINQIHNIRHVYHVIGGFKTWSEE
ncbi:hypothetical protein HZS_167, partial [Henneguya salminicola]